MRNRRGSRWLLALMVTGVAAVLLAGSARAEAGRDSTARDTTAARPAARDTTARPRSPGGGTVPSDSLPSDEARAVLRDIPEPLAADEQVEPPDSLVRESEREVGPDPSPADSTGVPIPAETAPLGERPGAVRSVFSDSAGAAPGAKTAPAGPAGGPPSTAPAAAVPDTCWRLQIAASSGREEAAAKRGAAESQLLVPFAIEVEQGRHKVRSRDCLTRTVADALRGRALLSGFPDAFLVRMGPDGKAISAAPPRPAPASKPVPARKPATKRRATSGSR